MDDAENALEVWFDFASPYSYLTAQRVETVAAAAGVQVVWRPFLLGPIFQRLHGTADSPFNRNAARGRWMWLDVERRSRSMGRALRRPTVFPRGSLLATRIALLAEREPWAGDFVRAVFRANFEADLDIGAEEVVRRILEPLTTSGAEWIERAGLAETKQRLRDRTEEAVRRGVFGAPTFFFRGEMYWGDDRLDDALTPSSGTQVVTGMTPEAARAFAARWLPAWTGNDPEHLLSFYAHDAFYLDPAVPQGVRGHAALLEYFRRLLRRNPSWVWTQREAIPMARGFVNLWHASIPMGERTHEIDGVCLVMMEGGRIERNEVHFDRSSLWTT